MTIQTEVSAKGNSWGAVPAGDGRWTFALWQPEATEVAVLLDGRRFPARRDADGFFRARLPAAAGDRYGFVVDGRVLPDPAARAQAGDVHGLSRLTDLAAYPWTVPWAGRPWHEAVIYELHIGTFTDEGTFAAAARRLPDLAALGFTAIEIMPVAQFAGQRGWGYDGVLPFAPHPAYGPPEDLQALVEAAHRAGMSVILDVVYNHFGPEGMYLPDAFFDARLHTPWGRSLDFAQPAVQSFFTENAVMWVRDYRMDGLRLDAVPQIIEAGGAAFLDDLGRRLRALDPGRPIHLVVEDERNETDLLDGGLYDGTWNDDYHHAIHVLLTGERQGYYAPFAVDPMDDLLRCLQAGQARQGQDRTGDAPRGAPSHHLPSTAFINANQNHDQVGNRPGGERLLALADTRAVEVAIALLLLSPFVPMLFMGEEVGARTPFNFFADFTGDLADRIRRGHQPGPDSPPGTVAPPDPFARSTFEASRPFALPPGDADHWRTLTRDLIALRAAHVVPLLAGGTSRPAEVQRTGERALRATWTFDGGALTLHVNLGMPPDGAADLTGAVFMLGDVATDPFALCLVAAR